MSNRSAIAPQNTPERDVEVKRIRTTVTLDEELVRKAQAFTGVHEKSALIREALTQLVQREAARRLAALGGTMPGLERISRRRLPRK
ncbi:type II toxin-antitoxin system VapB family antitoxin [Terracidiphilus gabretensis]|uniref:type II toxin-antitoxin system VapB family antitoxin n=1 Tax=Terracidiphilus gabretensis TaxID=1577687 RepID=UPI001E368F33|nr:type II toxin-antitoxin system VapB family antitoxin [Terracidiphilus gabretensis]